MRPPSSTSRNASRMCCSASSMGWLRADPICTMTPTRSQRSAQVAHVERASIERRRMLGSGEARLIRYLACAKFGPIPTARTWSVKSATCWSVWRGLSQRCGAATKICMHSAPMVTARGTAKGRPPLVETWAPIGIAGLGRSVCRCVPVRVHSIATGFCNALRAAAPPPELGHGHRRGPATRQARQRALALSTSTRTSSSRTSSLRSRTF